MEQCTCYVCLVGTSIYMLKIMLGGVFVTVYSISVRTRYFSDVCNLYAQHMQHFCKFLNDFILSNVSFFYHSELIIFIIKFIELIICYFYHIYTCIIIIFIYFLVHLGTYLAYTGLDEKAVELLLTHIHDFLKYMTKNMSSLFNLGDYVVASPEYQRKAL